MSETDHTNSPESSSAVEASDVVQENSVAARESNQDASSQTAFDRLIEKCRLEGLKSTKLEDPFGPGITIEMKNGRQTRSIYVSHRKHANQLLALPLSEIVFLGSYAAISHYGEGWIEAGVTFLDSASRFLFRRRVFGASSSDQPMQLRVESPSAVTLILTEESRFLQMVDSSSSRLFIRIEGIDAKQHDNALRVLEEVSNSFFLQLDLTTDSALALTKDRFLSRRRRLGSRKMPQEPPSLPRYAYERDASALYWYGRSTRSFPLLQFLAFYQTVEFFFPHYSRVEIMARLRNHLKNPNFNFSKDSDINGLVDLVTGSRGEPSTSERIQFRAVVGACVTPEELRTFINESEERKKFYDSGFKEVSKVRISLREDGDIINQAVERLYDIRCKVVHAKDAEKGSGMDVILPFSAEADLLHDDIELMKYLARKVLFASGTSLDLKPLEAKEEKQAG